MPASQDLGLLEDVVPERRLALEVHAERSELAQLQRRQRPDVHRPRDRLTGGDRPRQVPEQVALWQRRGQVAAGDGAHREVEQRRRDLGIDDFVRSDVRCLRAAKVEERLPADEASRRARAAAQVNRIPLALAGGIEDEPEERLAVVTREIGAIRRTHEAVPKAVRRALELHRDALLSDTRPVEPSAPGEDVVDQRRTDDGRQKLVDDDPLVVPGGDLSRLRIDSAATVSWPAVVVAQPVDDAVVEFHDGRMEPGEHEVFVVARIAEDGRARGGARQILEEPAALESELGAVVGVVQLRVLHGTAAVHRVEVERRGAGVRGAFRTRRHAELRRRVERHVVVEELAEERHAGRVRGVVTIVGAQFWIRDETDWPFLQRVFGIEQATGSAELVEHSPHLRRRLQE